MSCSGPSKSRLQSSHLALIGFFLRIGGRTDRLVLGVAVEDGVGDGEEGLEVGGVVGLDGMSPPSPSLSIAESSMKRWRFLIG